MSEEKYSKYFILLPHIHPADIISNERTDTHTQTSSKITS
jgi:hypothetical protein